MKGIKFWGPVLLLKYPFSCNILATLRYLQFCWHIVRVRLYHTHIFFVLSSYFFIFLISFAGTSDPRVKINITGYFKTFYITEKYVSKGVRQKLCSLGNVVVTLDTLRYVASVHHMHLRMVHSLAYYYASTFLIWSHL